MPLIDALGMALLHSVWQASVLGVVLWALLRAFSSSPSVLRYTLGVLALGAAPVLFVATAAQHYDPLASDVAALTALSAAVQPVPAAPAVSVPADAVPNIAALLPAAVGVWALGVVVFSLLFLGGLWQARRLQREGLSAVPAAIQAHAASLASTLGLRAPVPVRASRLVTVPMVVGVIRPVILLPGVALTGLDSAQLESVLLHELAHVRRRDLLVSFLQGLVEIVFFFHPAVWWMSGRVRAERELCCDDVVVAHAAPRVYAGALLHLEEHRQVVAFAAAATDSSLRHRIERVLGQSAPPSRASRSAAAFLLLSGLGGLTAHQSLAGDVALSALMDDFLAMEVTLDDPDAPRAEQDADLQGDVLALVSAFEAVEDRMNALLEEDPERWRQEVLVRTAQAREHLGQALLTSDVPGYLDDDQREVYHYALEDKAWRQLQVALDAYTLAAEESTSAALKAEAEAGRARLEAQQAALPPEPAPISPALDAMLEESEAQLEAGEHKAALATLRRAERIVEDGLMDLVHFQRARALSGLGRHDKAIALMESVLDSEVEGLYNAAVGSLAEMYVAAGELEAGAARLEALGGERIWEAVLESQ